MARNDNLEVTTRFLDKILPYGCSLSIKFHVTCMLSDIRDDPHKTIQYSTNLKLLRRYLTKGLPSSVSYWVRVGLDGLLRVLYSWFRPLQDNLPIKINNTQRGTVKIAAD